jgi:adenylate cyclase
MKKEVAGKIVRCFINSASSILRHFGGEIRSFDGDRVMAIFMGGSKNNEAVKAAQAINWSVSQVIKPKIESKWSDVAGLWQMDHGIGIDTGEALIVRGGVRDNNDLISIGRAPNLAAKLSDLRDSPLHITEDVYSVLKERQRVSDDGKAMWVKIGKQRIAGDWVTIYSSTWWRRP